MFSGFTDLLLKAQQEAEELFLPAQAPKTPNVELPPAPTPPLPNVSVPAPKATPLPRQEIPPPPDFDLAPLFQIPDLSQLSFSLPTLEEMKQKTEEFSKVFREDVEKNFDVIDTKILPSLSAMRKEASDIASDMTFVFSSMPVDETIGEVLQVQSQKRFEEVFGRTIGFGSNLEPSQYQENYAAGQQLLNKYHNKLATISDNNKRLHMQALRVSNIVKQAILLAINAKAQWTKLEEGLQHVPLLAAQVTSLADKLKLLAQKAEQVEDRITADTLNFHAQKMTLFKNQKKAELENHRISLSQQLHQRAKSLEEQDKLRKQQEMVIAQQQKSAQEIQLKEQQKEKLEKTIKQQMEEFSTYGVVSVPRPRGGRGRARAEGRELQLQDITIQPDQGSLENFFSDQEEEGEDSTPQPVETTTKEEKQHFEYIDDETPEF